MGCCVRPIHSPLENFSLQPFFGVIIQRCCCSLFTFRISDSASFVWKNPIRARLESTKCTSTMIVPEVLTNENYEVWKIFMKSYLLGKGLWDIVEGSELKPKPTNPGFKAWRMRNGEALHAIMISCGEKVLFSIGENDSAKDAWDHLASEASIAEQAAQADAATAAEQAAAIEQENARVPIRLHSAMYCEDWEKTRELLGNGGDSITTLLSLNIGKVLQIAVSTGNSGFVKHLLDFIERHANDAVRSSISYYPALKTAAGCGFTEIARVLVASCGFTDHEKYDAAAQACARLHTDTSRFLYEKATTTTTTTTLSATGGASLINAAVVAEMYDIAIDLLGPHPELSITYDADGWTTIKTLALRPNAFASGGHYSTCQQWIHSTSRWFCGYGVVWSALNRLVPGIKSIHNKKKNQVDALDVLNIVCSQLSKLDGPTLELDALQVHESIFIATDYGTVEIVSELTKINPDLLFVKNDKDQSMLSVAILHRHEKLFNFLCQKRAYNVRLSSLVNNNNGNCILHDAGMLAPVSQQRKMAGAALQMQRELQWFQEVEKIVPSYFMDWVNEEGLKPRDLFTKEHKELVKNGEKWMKDTANSCMIVATLIATVTFAAAFTVPGGDDQTWGYPIFLRRKLFLLFMISDALSLFSSSTSVLMFLSIYTSRYAEEDFLKSLPKRLIIGLSTLFFSIATMMVAFCATIYLILGKHCKWAAILITFLAAAPVAFFILLQFPLFLDMILSTYGPGLFSSKGKKTLTD